MTLLLTEKPPWVLFGWTKIAQSGSEALQECDKIWPSGSEAFSPSSESSIFFTSWSSSLIYSPLYSCHCSFSASSSPGLVLLYYLLLLLHLLLLFFLLLMALLLLFILPVDITVQFYRLTPPSSLGNKPLYQARESSLVPLCPTQRSNPNPKLLRNFSKNLFLAWVRTFLRILKTVHQYN